MVGVLVVMVAAFTWVSDQAPSARAAQEAMFACATGNGTYVVPVGTTQLEVRVAGAQGGSSGYTDAGGGGAGAIVSAVVPVTAGQTITVTLGCGSSGFDPAGAGGSRGSSDGCAAGISDGGAGGGSTALALGSTTLVEAGGGGGGGGVGGCNDSGGGGGSGSQNGEAGGGGTAAGDGGSGGGGGAGGGQTGGTGANGENATPGDFAGGGGGGGGGCHGGGSGGAGGGAGGGGGGGGGGSSCADSKVTTAFETTGNSGDGFVTIDPISLTVTKTASGVIDTNQDGVQDAGDTIDYTVTVTNNSSVALTDVTVVDGLTAPAGVAVDLSCLPDQPPATLQPSGTLTCTGSYTLLTSDFDRGVVTNGATATGTLPALPGDQQGLSVQSSASVTTTLTDAGKLTITNSVAGVDDTNGNGVTDAGDVINYRIQATNSGNSTLADVTITEAVSGAGSSTVPLTCDPALPGPIVVGGTMTCTGSYTITAADVNATGATITATANGSATSRAGAGTTVTAPASVVTTKLTQAPALTAKLAVSSVNDTNGDGRDDAGDTVDYSVTVTNSGTVTLDGVGATVQMTAPAGPAPSLTCTPATPADLAPAGQLTCTGSYTITQADVDKGEVDAAATATGTSGTTTVTSPASTVTTPLQQSSALTATATVAGVDDVNGNGQLDVGDTIKYSVAVVNTGTVTLTEVSVVDQVASPAGPDPTLTCAPGQPATLAAGATMTCTGSYVVTQADVDKGSVTDTAIANGVSPTQQTVSSGPSSVTTPLGAAPALSIADTVTGVADTNNDSVDDAGDVISYDIVATNTGTVTLTTAAIADQLTPPAAPALTLQCSADAPVTLAPGDTLSCTATYTITQADVDKGTVVNTATATAKAPGNTNVTSGPGVATTALSTKGGLSVVNAVTSIEDRNSDSVNDQGDVIVYQVTVTNTGTVSLGDVVATEALAAPASTSPQLTCDPTAPATLAPGAKMTCTASYMVTAADVRHGTVAATATAVGTTPASAPVVSAQSVVSTTVLPTPAGVTVGGSSSGGTTGSSGGTGTSGGSGSSTGTGSTGSSAGIPGKLAYTGVDATPMVVAGVLFLAFGTGALLLTRRRRRS